MRDLIYKILAISLLLIASCIGCGKNISPTSTANAGYLPVTVITNSGDTFIAESNSGGVTGNLVINGATTIAYNTSQSIWEESFTQYTSSDTYIFTGFNSNNIYLEVDTNSGSTSITGAGTVTLSGSF